jgi:hypothetical protein
VLPVKELHIEQVHNMFSFCNILRMKKGNIGRTCTMHSGSEKCMQNLGSKISREANLEKWQADVTCYHLCPDNGGRRFL